MQKQTYFVAFFLDNNFTQIHQTTLIETDGDEAMLTLLSMYPKREVTLYNMIQVPKHLALNSEQRVRKIRTIAFQL